MAHTQAFNTLPRPTFRWLRLNEYETQLVDIAPEGSTVTLQGSTDIVTTLVDTDLMRDDFTGAQADALALVAHQFSAGYEINVPEGQQHRLVVRARLTDAQPAERLRLRINADAQSELDVLLLLEGNVTDASAFHFFLEVYGDAGSQVRVRKVQMLPTQCQHVEHRYVALADDAHLSYLQIELGAKEQITHAVTELAGDRAHLTHDMGYLGAEEQVFDISLLMQHEGRKTESDVHVVGALTDRARKTFRGTLDFVKGCSASEGAEEDLCLLLNDRVKSFSLPLLLCGEDNVVGNHAASAGQIDPQKLFYLMSRGFSESEAKLVLVESMLRPLIDRIEDEPVEEAALAWIRGRIHI